MFENSMVIKVEKCLIPSQDGGEFHSSLYSFVLKQHQLSPAGRFTGFVTSETSCGVHFVFVCVCVVSHAKKLNNLVTEVIYFFPPKNSSAPD